jgi:hypothetical protein
LYNPDQKTYAYLVSRADFASFVTEALEPICGILASLFPATVKSFRWAPVEGWMRRHAVRLLADDHVTSADVHFRHALTRFKEELAAPSTPESAEPFAGILMHWLVSAYAAIKLSKELSRFDTPAFLPIRYLVEHSRTPAYVSEEAGAQYLRECELHNGAPLAYRRMMNRPNEPQGSCHRLIVPWPAELGAAVELKGSGLLDAVRQLGGRGFSFEDTPEALPVVGMSRHAVRLPARLDSDRIAEDLKGRSTSSRSFTAPLLKRLEDGKVAVLEGFACRPGTFLISRKSKRAESTPPRPGHYHFKVRSIVDSSALKPGALERYGLAV